MSQYKTCSSCRQSLSIDNFSKDKSRKDGYSYRCKSCHTRMNKKYYDKEKGAAYSKSYYHKNKEAINQKAREKRAENPEKTQSYRRDYYQRNKQRINLLSNTWRKNNKETAYRSKVRRRARSRQNGYEFYTVDQVIEKYGTSCYLCGMPIDLGAPRWTAIKGWENGLHLDHVIRIADGGSDSLENVRPTHGLCNLKKH